MSIASNKKKIDIPISYLSSDEIHALSDDINSNYEEETDSLMNDSDTKFRAAIEYSESDISEAAIQEKDDSNVVTLFRQKKLIEAAVKIVKPDSESEKDGDDVPLSNLVVKKMFFRNGLNFLKSQH